MSVNDNLISTSLPSYELENELDKLVPSSAVEQGAVCMMCGVAGAGKTTVAKLLESRGFVRLSIDEWIWTNVGRYGVDYDASLYSRFQAEAEKHLRADLVQLMSRQQAVVIDFSFWQRSRRDSYRQLIEQAGRAHLLLYLPASRPQLLARLQKRRERFDANAAFPIEDELLDPYLRGFEEPSGEGELILETNW
jgi:predicted kinase